MTTVPGGVTDLGGPGVGAGGPPVAGSGRNLVATSHLLVFDRYGQATATREAIQRSHALANTPPPPAGAIVVGIGSGRYASAIWVSRADGSNVRDDPQAVPALRGLGYFNIDPAVAEGVRYGRQ
jgi:hypothetical protein